MKTYDADDVMTSLQNAVDEYGEGYIYYPPDGGSVCYYFYDGRPSCIVGQVLSAFGVTDDEYPEGPIDSAVYGDLSIRLTDDAVRILREAQLVQDSAVDKPGVMDPSWGAALRAARRTWFELA